MNALITALAAPGGISQDWDPDVLNEHWAHGTFYLQELIA